jgi:hypothetical protein
VAIFFTCYNLRTLPNYTALLETEARLFAHFVHGEFVEEIAATKAPAPESLSRTACDPI